MSDKISEECGVFGVYSFNDEEDLVSEVCIGLSALQHRGEESCGIAVNNYGIINYHHDLGLVSDKFTNDCLKLLPKGKVAVGHVRYSTTGNSNKNNAQPIVRNHKKGTIVVAHNGNLTNAFDIKEELENQGHVFTTTSDTEVIVHTIIKERIKTHSIEEAVKNTMEKIKGAYSLLIMSPRKLIAVRDPHGFRPLCMSIDDSGVTFSSESCALDITGHKITRDVEPGEMVVVENNKINSYKVFPNKNKSLCSFEYIYFARGDSTIDGLNVQYARELMGRFLARQSKVDADIVAGVPDSGLDAALGYSMESGIPYKNIFVKSKYIGRTFIQNAQDKRRDLVNLKLNPIRDAVKDKRIILIDDSIVRGTTITKIIKSLYEAGAKEIHIKIASPAFRDICYFGTDIDNKENLISNEKTVEEIRKIIGADSLDYLSLENLNKLTYNCNLDGICTGCFSGVYPVEVPDSIDKNRFENTPIQFTKKKR